MDFTIYARPTVSSQPETGVQRTEWRKTRWQNYPKF